MGDGRELRDVEYLHVRAKRIVNRVPEASRMPFKYTINAYRGCAHACTYCFARPTHVYLGMDARRRLRAPHRGQGERGRAAAGRAARPALGRRAHRHGHEHRPLPARRGPLPADAGPDRRADRSPQPVLDPDQVAHDPARPRSAGERRPGRARALQPLDRDAGRGGLAGERAGHAAAAAAGRGGRAPERRRRPLRRPGRSGAARACRTPPSSSPRWSRRASRPARSRSARSCCTCARACASSSCPGSRATGPTWPSATARCTPRRTRPRAPGPG